MLLNLEKHIHFIYFNFVSFLAFTKRVYMGTYNFFFS